MRLLLSLVGSLVLLFVLAQVLLPRIAASRISSRVGRYGKVRSVSVSAWPALELLWEQRGLGARQRQQPCAQHGTARRACCGKRAA